MFLLSGGKHRMSPASERVHLDLYLTPQRHHIVSDTEAAADDILERASELDVQHRVDDVI